MADSVDPDLCLHCLPRPICPKTMDHCSSIQSHLDLINGTPIANKHLDYFDFFIGL